MQEIVVIDGEISLDNTLDGEVELEAITDLDPEVVLSTGGAVYPHYSGSYTVTPSSSVQTLDTSDKVMDDDVTVNAVPVGSATTPATIITANPSISVSSGGLITATVSKTQQVTPTVIEGYVSAGTAGNIGVSGSNTEQLSVQAAQTIHPASTDQSIASGKYLTGAQIFKAVTVSGLTADKVLQGNVVKIGDADDDDRIMSVTGTASGGITPTGTKSITANGTGIDVYNYQYADVAVPNSYSASDEGKVVSNGALVAQTSDTVTANDTYDTTLINSLTVNVSGGGSNLETEILSGTLSGAYTNSTVTTLRERALADCASLTSLSLPALTTAGASAFRNDTNLATVDLPNMTTIGSYAFSNDKALNNVSLPKLGTVNNNAFEGCTGLTSISLPNATQINNSGLRNCRFSTIVLPKVTKTDTYCIADNANLTAVDIGDAAQLGGGSGFINDTNLTMVVLRRTASVPSIGNINYFNNTPFKSGGTGGTLYVPSALISSYQSASNWSTILGYTNNQIKSIESTHTDPTAPIDLTLYYVDGTLIPTT